MHRASRSSTLTAIFLGALALVASCGRSGLQQSQQSGAGGSGSSGASGSTSATTSTTSSGAGGPPLTCELLLTGAPLTYKPSPPEHASRPALVPVSSDGSIVSVVFAGKDPMFDTFSRIASVTLSPWESWPESLGEAFKACYIGGETFAASPSMAPGPPSFSLLFYQLTNAFPSDMFLAPITGITSDGSYPMGVSWDAWEPAWPVALARSAARYLAAYELQLGATATLLNVGLVEPSTLEVSVISDVACANAPFPAHAVPAEGGFLVATAAGRPFGACPLDDGVNGPPSEVQVIKVDELTKSLTLTASFQGFDPLAHVALAKLPKGAWLAWQENGESAFTPPPIAAVLLDEAGSPVSPTITLTGTGYTTIPFAATALGPWLAVAWYDAISPDWPAIWLSLFDEMGALMTSTSLAMAPNLYDGSPPSLLASPDGTALLLAWSDWNLAEPAAMHVARFSCATAP
jgi:hypothetical protein